MIQHWILKKFAMTFTLDIKTWFKVTAHRFPTSTIYVKYKPNRAKQIIHVYGSEKDCFYRGVT